jgi:hypothetical protein
MKTILHITKYATGSLLLGYAVMQAICYALTQTPLSAQTFSTTELIFIALYYIFLLSSSLLYASSSTEALGPAEPTDEDLFKKLTSEPAYKRRTPTNFNDNDPAIGI